MYFYHFVPSSRCPLFLVLLSTTHHVLHERMLDWSFLWSSIATLSLHQGFELFVASETPIVGRLAAWSSSPAADTRPFDASPQTEPGAPPSPKFDPPDSLISYIKKTLARTVLSSMYAIACAMQALGLMLNGLNAERASSTLSFETPKASSTIQRSG